MTDKKDNTAKETAGKNDERILDDRDVQNILIEAFRSPKFTGTNTTSCVPFVVATLKAIPSVKEKYGDKLNADKLGVELTNVLCHKTHRLYDPINQAITRNGGGNQNALQDWKAGVAEQAERIRREKAAAPDRKDVTLPYTAGKPGRRPKSPG